MAKDNFNSVREHRDHVREIYNNIGSIYCRAVNDNVVFNGYGLKHLTHRSNGARRNVASSHMRLFLFTSWVVSVIKLCKMCSNTNIETATIKGVERQVTYFELHYSFKMKNKITNIIVVLRKIDNNPIHYWTVRYGRK